MSAEIAHTVRSPKTSFDAQIKNSGPRVWEQFQGRKCEVFLEFLMPSCMSPNFLLLLHYKKDYTLSPKFGLRPIKTQEPPRF